MSKMKNEVMLYIAKNNAPGGAVFRRIKRDYPELCSEIEKSYPGRCWTEKLYRWAHPECIDVCKMCGRGLRYWDWENGFRTYCSIKCKKTDPEIQSKTKNTCILKYGVDNPNKSEHIREKTKQTCLSKYGVENPMKADEIKEKQSNTVIKRYGVSYIGNAKSPFRNSIDENRKKTFIERYGVENSFNMKETLEKRKSTWMRKYGAEHPHKCNNVRDTFIKTNISRYGVEYPMQCADVMDKSIRRSKTAKPYTLPSGRTIYVQGYEPQALDTLFLEGFRESDIITERSLMPDFWWVDNSGKHHRYYPDFYIKDLKLIIEVKSPYTATIRTDIIEKKKQAVIDDGYIFRLMVMEKKKG